MKTQITQVSFRMTQRWYMCEFGISQHFNKVKAQTELFLWTLLFEMFKRRSLTHGTYYQVSKGPQKIDHRIIYTSKD